MVENKFSMLIILSIVLVIFTRIKAVWNSLLNILFFTKLHLILIIVTPLLSPSRIIYNLSDSLNQIIPTKFLSVSHDISIC